MVKHPIRVVLATADRVLAESLARCLDAENDLNVSAVLAELDGRLDAALNSHAGVVVFDADSPLAGTFDAIERIKKGGHRTRVALLAGRHIDIIIEQALRLKVDAYLSKSQPVTEFLHGIRTIASGEQWYSQEVKSRLRFDPRNGTFRLSSAGRLSSLTTRQLEVLRHLAHGLSTKEVAREMHLSDKAIESHKYRIMNKLDMHDRVELARYAIREGLVLP